MSSAHRPATPFIWYELMTSDHKAAFPFYKQVFGWSISKSPLASHEYMIANAGPYNAAGMMTIPAEAHGMPPCWAMYLGVADVEATCTQVEAAGGSVLRAPDDIPGVGRFAVLADPDGAMFIVMKPISNEPMPVVPENTPGVVGWRELQAGDGDRALAWYIEQFGWTQAGGVDMGPNGTYHMFAAGGTPVGGIMTKVPEAPMAFWSFYFNVVGLDAAVARVRAGGGGVMIEAHEVPGPMWIAYVTDPQGAVFGMVAPKR
jgi:predicted enzyme related to lactoylglutathione lyase